MVTERPDDQVRQDAWEALSHDIRVDMDEIELEVTNGTVFLRGTVSSLYDKRVLTEIVGRIKGVLGVVNEVKVVPTARRLDSEITSEVKAALARDEWVDERNVQVEVRDGVVNLSGPADSYTQKYYAESDAWATPGVVDIINDMVIRPMPVRADADIAGEIENGLERNIRVDPSKIAVDVVDGVAHLKGSVANTEQKRLAEDVAWWTAGITDVVNELAVQP